MTTIFVCCDLAPILRRRESEEREELSYDKFRVDKVASAIMTHQWIKMLALLVLLLDGFVGGTQAFLAPSSTAQTTASSVAIRRGIRLHAERDSTTNVVVERSGAVSRRQLIQSASVLLTGMTSVLIGSSSSVIMPSPAFAAERQSLDSVLYRIMRAKEAILQETRLIKTGKFKDVQRANVKLAVGFVVRNYRLNDAFVTASSYLDGNDRRVEAGQVGQSAVQNLYTILEYFDSSDVQNIKVGQDGLGGKEQLVLKGLDATRKSIDEFIAYFPKTDVDAVAARIAEENRLNVKEFDPTLGDIINLPPPS